jgi:hypothetical protein
MPTVPSNAPESNLTPSSDELYSDARVEVSPLPATDAEDWHAEMERHFGYGTAADGLSDAELDELYIAHMEAINEPPCVFAPFDYAPLPEVRSITSTVRKIDLSVFPNGGKAAL